MALDAQIVKMPNLNCDTCGMSGHEGPYCWVPNQLYQLSQSAGQVEKGAYLVTREYCRAERKMAAQEAKNRLRLQMQQSGIQAGIKFHSQNLGLNN